MHDEVDDVEGLAVCGAVAGEAVGGVGLVLDLHRGRAVVVERAVEPELLVGLEVVVPEHLRYCEALFDLGDRHGGRG